LLTQLGHVWDGWPLVCGQELGAIEHPHEATLLLNCKADRDRGEEKAGQRGRGNTLGLSGELGEGDGSGFGTESSGSS
jgi:hypothetical protein